LSKQTVIQLLQQIDPKLTMSYLRSHSERHQALIYNHKLAAGLTIVLSILALILAAAGIYGVLNYSTQMRRYELGIHLALGAKTHSIRNMVLKESLKPVMLGLGLSSVLVLLGYLLAKQQFSSVWQPDVLSIGSTLIIMLAVAFTACYLPVKKVIMDDPIKALRNE
jgi:putative ABC transport system permease protein